MFGPISVIVQDPLIFLVLVFAFLAGLVLRGVVQARLAARLGDRVGLEAGFGSPDPAVHLGLWSLVLYLLLGCGLPRAVPSRLRGGRGVLVALAGPLTLLLWALLLLLQQVQAAFATPLDVVGRGLGLAAQGSALHALFFLLPLPALDGERVLRALATPAALRLLAGSQRAGLILSYIAWLALSLSGAFAWVLPPLMNGLRALLSWLPF